MIAGRATIFKDKKTNKFLEIENIEELLNNSEKKKEIRIIDHVFCGIRFGENYEEIFLTFFTTKSKTRLNKNELIIENIETLNNRLGYTNPLWYLNYKNMEKFAIIKNNISSFPTNFLEVSNNDKKNLSNILFKEFQNTWENSLKLNKNPICFSFENNSLNSATYNSLESKVLASSYLGLLNKYHSKIFLDKTKMLIEDYYEINTKITQGDREKCIHEINESLN